MVLGTVHNWQVNGRPQLLETSKGATRCSVTFLSGSLRTILQLPRPPWGTIHFATFIREAPPLELMLLAKEQERYKVEGSPGQGNWAKVPWISVFDLLVTDSAQRGYYPVYLFRNDMLGA